MPESQENNTTVPATEDATPKEATVLLIDGHSLLYRGFHAMRDAAMSNGNGVPTGAIFGFMRMVLPLLEKEQPTHVAAAFDLSGGTFRTEQYSEYKAGRAKTPDEFKEQLPLAQELLRAMGISVLTKQNYEADDILATLAHQAHERNMKTFVVSGDKDSVQMVTDNVTVLYPRTSFSDIDRLTPERVEEKYGVTPDVYPDVAALVGEKADNLPGVPGVGNKTAIKWLTKYGSLSELIEQADDIAGKVGERLREHLDDVRRNRQLNELLTDLELEAGIDDLRLATPDPEELSGLLTTLSFEADRDRFYKVVGLADTETLNTEPAIELQRREPGANLAATVTDLAHDGPCAVVPLLDDNDQLNALAFAAATGHATVVHVADNHDAIAAALATNVDFTCHDGKELLHALASRDLEPPQLVSDVDLMAYLVNPDQRKRELADLATRYLGRELPTRGGNAEGQLDFATDTEAADDALGEHALAVAMLHDTLLPQVQERGAADLMTDLELPLQKLLVQLERTGIAVDTQMLERLDSEFANRAEGLQTQAYEVIGEEVNLGSPKQLQRVLFEVLDMPKTRKTKTGYSTDADSLNDLFDKTEHPFLEYLLAHREVTKQRTTVTGLLKAVQSDGRIHTTFQQTVAATGRLSSTDPNLQNIPVRTAEGRRIRDAFIVGEGYDCLLSADYSQIELRIMAHLSGDDALAQAFRSGEDLHAYVGSQIFHVTPDEVTSEMRSKVKAMSYGLAYGLSAFGLSKQLRISDAEARQLMEMYFERFSGIQEYLSTVVHEATKTTYTETMFGRRRYLPDLQSSNRQRREMAERMALNAPIQGTAADIMKRAMLDIETALRNEGLASRLLLQVHDEVIVEVADGEHDLVTSIVTRRMADAADLSVPLDVSTGYGRTWQDAAH